jgi:hypothetical protein
MLSMILLFTLAAAPAPAPGEALAYLRDGRSVFTIVIPAAPSPAEQLAADEVAKYLSQLLGVEVPIVNVAGGTKLPDHPLVIAEAQRHLVATDKPLTDEAYLVNVTGEQIQIVGGRGRSVLFGAYRFLDSIGCRFLAPQFAHYRGAAEIVPRALTRLQLQSRAVPRLKFRKLYVEEGHSHTIGSLKQLVEWMPKVGYNTLVIPTNYQGHGRVKWDNWRKDLTPELQKRDLIIEVGGHGYQNFINADMGGGKLFQQHPDWFGQDASGRRTPSPERVFCTSNSQAVGYFLDNFLAYIRDRPEIQIYDLWPPDGAKWCACDACRKLGDPPDRQAILLRQVSAAVKPIRPDLRLEVIAYASCVQPPAREALDPGVLVDFCPINQQFDHQIDDPAAEKNNHYVQALTAWRRGFAGDISIYSYYRKYAWDSLPVVIPHYLQDDLRWYAKLPAQGVSTYSEPGDWFTYELNHYALAALAWDPDADVEALIERFCAARYGADAPAAKSALETLENTTRIDGSIPNTSLKSPGDIAAAGAQVQAALQAVQGAESRAAEERIQRSLERLGLMCIYAARDLEIQHLRAAGADRAVIVDKATSLHGFVADHADDGVFLINAQRLNLDRMLSRYGVGPRKKRAGVSAPAPQ